MNRCFGTPSRHQPNSYARRLLISSWVQIQNKNKKLSVGVQGGADHPRRQRRFSTSEGGSMGERLPRAALCPRLWRQPLLFLIWRLTGRSSCFPLFLPRPSSASSLHQR